MPVVLAPALDLAALAGVMLLIGLLAVISYTFVKLASVLNFSILGVHPLANVASAIENTIVAGCNEGISALDEVALALWHGLTWAWGEFLDGVHAFTHKTEAAFNLLWSDSIPTYVRAALRPLAKEVAATGAEVSTLGRTVARDINRLDAKIETAGAAALATAEHVAHKELTEAIHGIDEQVRAIRSSVDQAIEHALNLARAESSAAIGELRAIEQAAVGSLQRAEGATERELQDLIRDLNPTQLLGIAASVPLLAQLVQTLARETGLENPECRSKVKNICSTDPTDWANLLAGATAFGAGIGLAEIIAAGREVIQYVSDGALDFA